MSRFASLAVLCSLTFVVIVALPSFAQVPDPVAAAEAPEPGKGHHYIGIGAETVNPADGSLSFDLPLTPANARELNFPFGIRFTSGTEQYYLSNKNSQGPQLAWTTWGLLQGTPWQSGAWSYDLPILTAQVSVFQSASINTCGPIPCYQLNECYGTNDYVFRGLDGTQNTMQIATLYAGPTNNFPNYCPNVNGVTINQFSPGIGHGVYAAMQSTSMAPPVTVIDRAGTTYQFPGTSDYNPPTQPWAFGFLATSITDKNGNVITQNLDGKGYTDTVGRNAVTWTGLGHSGDQINVAGLGGPITLQWTTTNLSFPETGVNVGGSANCTLQSMSPTQISAVSEIDLPNLQKYTFQYDGTYGKISQINFPGNGHVRYVWHLISQAKDVHATWTVPPSPGFNGGTYDCYFNYSVPAITDRYVSFDGTTEPLHQTFVYTNTYSGGVLTGKATTVTSTDSLSGQVTVTKYTYGLAAADGVPVMGNAGQQQIPVETQVLFQDNASHTLKTVNKTWISPHAIAGEQTILDNGQGTATQRCYDGNEEVTYLVEYGFQSEGSKPTDPTCYSSMVRVGALTNSAIGPIRRQTTTAYHPFFTWGYTNSTLPHIVNAPDSVVVADGAGNLLKHTTFAYDETAPVTSGAIDWVQPVYATADITTINRYTSTSAYTTTKYTYYDTGQVASMTDPCGNSTCSDMTGSNHTTTYSYADSYASGTGTPPGQTNAFLTTVTFANTGKAHVEKFTWGYSDGQIRSHKDQNGRSASFVYSDPGLLARLTEIDYPDGGQLTVTYNDATYSATNFTPSYTVSQKISTSPVLNKVVTTAFDGLGHNWATLLADTSSTDYTVTTLDGFARTWKSYNPTRCNPPTGTCSEATWGFSTTTYDILDRVTSVLKPDGSSASTSYSGACTTVTDESGKSRTSCKDGLGLLTKVTEAPTGFNFETDYAYDALGNLLCAVQKATDATAFTTCVAASSTWRPRSFTYDLLSRLKCAANPEVTSSANNPVLCPTSDSGTYTAGTIGYTYDANGNLSTKTAPAPNQTTTSATAVTNYTYDSLNRPIQKSYTGGASTATVQYAFDGTSLGGCTTTPPTLSPVDANPISYRTAMCDGSGATAWAHDTMGRVIKDQRIINGTSAFNKATTYTYYLDGELKTLLYPGATHTITYTPAATGRLVSAVDNGSSINYATSAAYGPQGALASITMGGTISGAFSYTSRLQPLQIFYGTNTPPDITGTTCPSTVGNIMHRIYDFGFGAGDNGNINKITNCRDNTNRTETFTYDSMNRIATAATQGTSCAACWGYRYGHLSGSTFVPGIDAWGNLFEVTVTSQGTALTQTANIKNQFISMTYDASGNLTNDGGGNSYTYDDENRITTTGGYTYVYDGNGSRVKKCTNSGCTTGTLYWTGGDANVLSESGVNGSIAEEYIFFGAARIARRDASGGAVHYYFADHLGSSDVITSNTGAIQKETDFTPYGGEVVVTGSDTNHFKFTGKERDETGLDNFGARFYASSFGRFMTPDWAARPTAVPYAKFGDPQTLNLYTYVENSPVNSADADGHGDDCGKNPFLAECSSSANTKNGGESEAQTQDKADISKTDASAAQNTAAAAVVASPTTMEAIDSVVKPLVESAQGALDTAAGSVFGAIGIVLLSPEKLGGGPGDVPAHVGDGDQAPAPAAAAGGSGKGKKPHGNTAGDQYAELYARYDINGTFLKWGVSQNAAKRYSPKELAGGRIDVLETGPRKNMLGLERMLVRDVPGPLNKEPWAGADH